MPTKPVLAFSFTPRTASAAAVAPPAMARSGASLAPSSNPSFIDMPCVRRGANPRKPHATSFRQVLLATPTKDQVAAGDPTTGCMHGPRIGRPASRWRRPISLSPLSAPLPGCSPSSIHLLRFCDSTEALRTTAPSSLCRPWRLIPFAAVDAAALFAPRRLLSCCCPSSPLSRSASGWVLPGTLPRCGAPRPHRPGTPPQNA